MSRCARNTEEYVKQTWHLMYLKMRGEGTATEQDESWEKKKNTVYIKMANQKTDFD